MHYTQIIIILFYLLIVVLWAKFIFKKGEMVSFEGILCFIAFSYGIIKLLTMNTELLEDVLRYTFYFVAFILCLASVSVILKKKSKSSKEISQL